MYLKVTSNVLPIPAGLAFAPSACDSISLFTLVVRNVLSTLSRQ